MAKTSRGETTSSRGRAAPPPKTRARTPAPKVQPAARAVASQAGWATDLVFDVREPKLAVSLRLDADVLRFFRGFGAGYQTRINEVLKTFMQARGGAEPVARPMVAAKGHGGASNGKRAR